MVIASSPISQAAYRNSKGVPARGEERFQHQLINEEKVTNLSSENNLPTFW